MAFGIQTASCNFKVGINFVEWAKVSSLGHFYVNSKWVSRFWIWVILEWAIICKGRNRSNTFPKIRPLYKLISTTFFKGIEGASETLEQLWISYNQIDRLKPIRSLQRLKILYMSHNYVREWREFEHMAELPALEDLVFIGNPLEEETSNSGKYTDEVTKRLLYLKKLDGYPVIRTTDNDDDEDVKSTLDAEEIENMAR